MRAILVINPYATNYDPNRRRVVEGALDSVCDLTVVETARHGHGLPIVQGAVHDGVDAVFVWGGDGMVNEAANGLAGTRITLGIIPGGSTSVTARGLGIPNDVTQATGELLRRVEACETRRIGLGKMGEHYFSFAAGIGFDAAIVREVERRSMLKRTIGPTVYVAAALAVYQGGFDRRNPGIRFRYDDGTTSPPLFLAMVSNTSPYTYLGDKGLVLSPKASFDTPLEVFGLTRIAFGHTLRLAASAFTNGRALDNSPYVHRRTTTAATMEGLFPLDVQADGEYRGERTNIEFVWAPEVLDVYA